MMDVPTSRSFCKVEDALPPVVVVFGRWPRGEGCFLDFSLFEFADEEIPFGLGHRRDVVHEGIPDREHDCHDPLEGFLVFA